MQVEREIGKFHEFKTKMRQHCSLQRIAGQDALMVLEASLEGYALHKWMDLKKSINWVPTSVDDALDKIESKTISFSTQSNAERDLSDLRFDP